MNRSILIVICDFLLLSLLTFSVDINRIADESTRPPLNVVVATNELADAGNNLGAVMKQALEEERKSQEQMQQQLADSRDTMGRQKAQLSQREQENQQLQQQLAAARDAAGQQQAQLSRRERENQQLQQQFAAARTNIENLTRQLQTTPASSPPSDLTAALRAQMEQLSRNSQLTQDEKERLAKQLQQVVEERNAAIARAALMQNALKIQEMENARLAGGLRTPAVDSNPLPPEIMESRNLSAEAIYNQFAANRIQAYIQATRSGFLGLNSSKNKATRIVLATDGVNIFALCHVQNTPLNLGGMNKDWDTLTGILAGNSARVAVQSVSFHQSDPRLVMMPISLKEATLLGGKVYRLTSDPYKFLDAVLVGADRDYYGECSFQVDSDAPGYVKLERSLSRGVSGTFDPARGDLVFSHTGELLGIMINSDYCLMIRDFTAAATIQFGPDVRRERTGAILSQLSFNVFQLPARLQ